MKTILSVLLILTLNIMLVSAQSQIQLKQSAGYMSNSYFSSNEMADLATTSTLDFRQGVKLGRVSADAYYGGEWTQFQHDVERQNFQHEIGLVTSFSQNSGSTSYYAGAHFAFGDYQDTYEWLDSKKFSLFLSVKHYIKQNIIY